MDSAEYERALQIVVKQPGAVLRSFGYKFQCPECRAEGFDANCDNAVFFTKGNPGKWGCAWAKDTALASKHWDAIGHLLGVLNGDGVRERASRPVPPAAWPVMDQAAYYGLPGRIVATIAPYSEADPVALLMHVLVGTGNMLGRGPHALVEKTEHTCGEFVVLVGDTSKARKGQSWSTPKYLLTQVDEKWATSRILSGLSSGEGLIFRVRDPRYEQDKKGGTACVDEGEQDKRLLVFEPELATVLRRMQGEMTRSRASSEKRGRAAPSGR